MLEQTDIDFYPRPPRGGRRQFHSQIRHLVPFLSTPSARRATSLQTAREQLYQFLSTPSARRATCRARSGTPRMVFLSTPSARRATQDRGGAVRRVVISIHALREEGDTEGGYVGSDLYKFLSTPSARRATRGYDEIQTVNLFLSTPSARRATFYCTRGGLNHEISIHALREEGDAGHGYCFTFRLISIHALREEGDVKAPVHLQTAYISIHALREEGDRSGVLPGARSGYFYPRPPRGGRL